MEFGVEAGFVGVRNVSPFCRVGIAVPFHALEFDTVANGHFENYLCASKGISEPSIDSIALGH